MLFILHQLSHSFIRTDTGNDTLTCSWHEISWDVKAWDLTDTRQYVLSLIIIIFLITIITFSVTIIVSVKFIVNIILYIIIIHS